MGKVKKLMYMLKKHWRIPAEGRYMCNREIASLSIGGIGIRLIVYCINNMILSVGNTLIGNTIGIEPRKLYVIYLIGVLSGFPLTALRARMIDNTRSMKGKYRPYLLSMGIPSVILGIGFVWMPYEGMTLLSKCVTVLLFNIGFQFFFNFMNDAYDSLLNVLSPNSIERSDVYAVKSVVENISPSIVGIFLPVVAKLITGEDTLYNIKIYRYVYPPLLIFGLLLSIIVYVNTEEKIVQAKTHVIQIKFTDALRAVAKNKYFWIISLAGWLGFLENSFSNIIGWMYNYQKACTAGQYSLIIGISGNASLWPTLVGPLLIRKYGKRKILVISNLLNIGLILTMLPVVRMTGSSQIIWILLGCTFANTFFSSLGNQMNPSLNADIRDYQHYVTGERIDGMFAAVGLIGSAVTLATSSILPTIYSKTGLNPSVAVSLGYSANNVYDVLFNHDYFVKISSVLVIASVVGAVLNVIPFFFYDLTETKQKAMVCVLKIRALFEDYGNGVLSDERLVEAIDIIEQAKEFEGKTFEPLTGEAIRAARKSGDRVKVKAASAKYKENRADIEKAEISQYVMRELRKFDTDEGKFEAETAEKIAAAGLMGFMEICSFDMSAAKAMPKTTRFEKEKRTAAILSVQKARTAKKTAKKYYPDGLTEFDIGVFEKLFVEEDKNEKELHEALGQMKLAKETGNRTQVKQLKGEVSDKRRLSIEIKREIKKATNQNSIFSRAAKPYLEARAILAQRENYRHYEDIFSQYGSSKQRVDQRREEKLKTN